MNPTVAHRAQRWLRWQAYQVPTVLSRWVADRSLPPARQPEVVSSAGTANDPLRIVDEPAAIEPRHGYVVHGRLGVIDESLPLSAFVRRRETRVYLSDFPSPLALGRRGRVVEVAGMALSLRHPFDDNYFHATVDCIGRLALYESLGLLGGNTVVIGPGLAKTRIWREVVETGVLAGVDIVVQEDQWIRGESGVAYLPIMHDRRTLGLLVDLVGRAVEDERDRATTRRIYVRRGAGQGRRVRQETELAQVLEDTGFDAVDPGALAWRDQVRVFRGAEAVVGVHGAALTNILFRHPETMNVFEIHAPGGSETAFAQMATRLGYRYTYLEGTNPSERGNRADFDVDVDEVADAVHRVLGERGGADPT